MKPPTNTAAVYAVSDLFLLYFDLKQHHHALADAEACAHIALELFKIDDDSY
ncbi:MULTISPECIES: hypothetical protein [Capnocytophaga]|uniref:hypothetical protein n=1 Tax=Capnocytophaga TaxID=1016 RepID=UPI001E423194|nr:MULTISPECIES: hypothetical protein [Capnocytophaga]